MTAPPPIGPRNLPGLLIVKRLKMEGFIVMDYAKEHGNAIKHLSEMNVAGDIKVTEDITEGLENVARRSDWFIKWGQFWKANGASNR